MRAWYCKDCARDIQKAANRDNLVLFQDLAKGIRQTVNKRNLEEFEKTGGWAK
jgi:hypothetical protein